MRVRNLIKHQTEKVVAGNGDKKSEQAYCLLTFLIRDSPTKDVLTKEGLGKGESRCYPISVSLKAYWLGARVIKNQYDHHRSNSLQSRASICDCIRGGITPNSLRMRLAVIVIILCN